MAPVSSLRSLVTLSVVFTLGFVQNLHSAERQAALPNSDRVTITQTNHHGWANSWILGNGTVEAIIVPAIGRMMQFRFIGDLEGPFWENRAMDAKQPDPQSKDWGNFGGDKSWPAPQEDWPKITGRGWPPPPAFDSMPNQAQKEGNSLRLTSPVDPFYGIQVTRLFTLAENGPEMIVGTTYTKVQGSSVKVAIWTITQLKDPVGVFLQPYPLSPWPSGYNKQSNTTPPSLRFEDRLLSLTRDHKNAYKIGAQTSFLLWIGKTQALRIFNAYVPKADYPDHSSNAEVYTNPDPLPYVELEMLSPLHEMRIGDKITDTRGYTLFRCEQIDPMDEARRLLGN